MNYEGDINIAGNYNNDKLDIATMANSITLLVSFHA
jgi:hypothetical protein